MVEQIPKHQIVDQLVIGIAYLSEAVVCISVQEAFEPSRTVLAENLGGCLFHVPLGLEKCCFCPKNKIEAAAFDGLLVEYCRNRRAHFIVRGIRAFIDFEYEYAVYLMNKRLASEIDTIFLMARSEYSFISSNMVKEVARYGGDISTLVPSFVNQKLIEKNSR